MKTAELSPKGVYDYPWDTVRSASVDINQGVIASLKIVLKETYLTMIRKKEVNHEAVIVSMFPPSHSNWYLAECFFWIQLCEAKFDLGVNS